MIYSLLVIEIGSQIPIDTPQRATAHKKELHSRANLLGVNRQINEEVMSVFYSKNIWIVGNGHWGSRRMPNLQALRMFVSKVPRQNIAQIKSVVCGGLVVQIRRIIANSARYSKSTPGGLGIDGPTSGVFLDQRPT
jgi:polysaccharide deacetylase 2 family uncharacterized protein YibQ